MTAFWFSINEPTLHQGDLLPDCLIPEFTETFGDSTGQANMIYLEHFSQAFARSFMRVGLPSSVPEF